jgi:hypothetical protein
MADMTIQEFCDLHGACPDGREWAMKNCRSMREVWDTAKPLWLIWVATRRGVLSDQELCLFAAAVGAAAEATAEATFWATAAQAEWLRTNCTPRFARVADKEEVTT